MRHAALIGVAVLALAIMAGCTGFPGWNMPAPHRTGVDPQLGKYTGNGFTCLFSVVAGSTPGEKVIHFSRDHSRYDDIPIRNGGFEFEWGEIGGTHCPTDAYAISGWFVAPDRAVVNLKWGDACRITGSGNYVLQRQTD
jgi:hypothetical protein